jgi:hypothetical protein
LLAAAEWSTTMADLSAYSRALFVVPTIGFDLLYAFVIVRLDRKDMVWINVTTVDCASDKGGLPLG